MKAARTLTERWEAENWLRLIEIYNVIYSLGRAFLKNALIVLNLALYAVYLIAKYLYFTIKLIFLTETNLVRIERNESWTFRTYR